VRAKPLPGGGSVPSRTQVVCLHEGKKGHSIDPVFIRVLLKALDPAWLRPWKGNNVIRAIDCGGRADLISRMPTELRNCLEMGGDTTLMVWADLDHDMADGAALRQQFWTAGQQAGITQDEFAQVVFVFAKDRLENWVEFLLAGSTDESKEGPRLKHDKPVADAARELARRCKGQVVAPPNPPSLDWSCQNWRRLVERMRR
jgi:hypothetical protein